jgi:hypothetical protein
MESELAETSIDVSEKKNRRMSGDRSTKELLSLQRWFRPIADRESEKRSQSDCAGQRLAACKGPRSCHRTNRPVSVVLSFSACDPIHCLSI